MRRKYQMGALMDEYERAIHEISKVVKPLKQINYQKALNKGKFNSFHSVINHVINAGFQYANDIRDAFNISKKAYSLELEYVDHVVIEFNKMFKYMLASVDNIMEMPENEFGTHNIPVSWDQTYDLEQLIEHAIVHILRHRRQLEHFWKLLR